MTGGAEHHFRRVIAGDIDSVRQRLSDVLEDFGYMVLGETPIQAKRARQKSIWVAMVLDYDTKLTIALKPISPASTLATFDYDIEQLFSKGEMQALEREAEAIIALATSAAPIEVFCPACGAENAGNARFCRVCGKPGARHTLPSELEVMRLTALTSASQIEITLGLILCVLALLLPLPIILTASSTGGVGFGWLLLTLGELAGSYFLFLGMRRLHRVLNPSNPAPPETSTDTGLSSKPARAALPPQPASIVEGTTELMTPQKVPTVVGQTRDTDSME